MSTVRTGLTAQFVNSVKQSGKYYDGRGDGLILRVAPGGSKQWLWRGMVQGRRRDYGLGPVRYTPLAEARRIAFEYRRVAYLGGDPKGTHRTMMNPAQPQPAVVPHVVPQPVMQPMTRSVPTFADATEVVIGLYAAKWKPGSRSPDQWRQSLGDYAFPKLGSKQLDQITTADVMAVLTPIWTTKPTTAKRIRQRISAIMAWAVAQGYRADDPAGAAITKALPKTNGPKKHLAAVPHREAPAAVRKIRASGGYHPVRLATEFAILTAARSSEVRGAQWSEIDREPALWTIPATRMKAGREHRVPLASEALRVLAEAEAYSQPSDPSAFVFPNKKGRELGSWQLSKLVAGLDLGGTLHGFRSTFRDWCSNQSVPREIAELCLAHRIGSAAEQAYARSDILEQRRKVMKAWGQHIER
ncbi:MAG: tyrosine-type recombinase/integrase [bacterium]|nr:tyrosine-type recombinase/integrase [bacterium]MDE0289844.1 tyrosine-type recombinase/integrase [bacterium]MDE0440271.1 tyrosine-type recombinase/integrase [bacterium]